MRDCEKLAPALVRAQQRVGQLAPDAWNDYQRYRYVSAEKRIRVCTGALNDEGLALVPAGSTVGPLGSVTDSKGKTVPTYIVTHRYLLVHQSGQSLPIEADFPAVVEPGRPADKAVAASRTAAFAYVLRDLLSVAQGAQDDLHRPDDGSQQQTRSEPAKQSRPPLQQAEPLEALREKMGQARWNAAFSDWQALNKGTASKAEQLQWMTNWHNAQGAAARRIFAGARDKGYDGELVQAVYHTWAVDKWPERALMRQASARMLEEFRIHLDNTNRQGFIDEINARKAAS